MTGKELVAFARSKLGTAYVYGMKGDMLTKEKYDRLKILFGPWSGKAMRKRSGRSAWTAVV